MSDQLLLFLLLVLPVLVVGIVTYLAILAVSLGTIVAAFKAAHPLLKGTLLLVGVLVILSPVLFHTGMEMRAGSKADQRQAALAQLDRTRLAGRLPGKFVAVDGVPPELLTFLETKYGLRMYPETENKRLADAYRAYRHDERCHRISGDQMMPGTRIPICGPVPDSIQSALELREPLLVFAEDFSTSMLEDNTIAGKIYEIRLITPQEDLLVAYYEERTVEGTPSVFNPYASGRHKASGETPPTRKAFIEAALEGASR